VICFSVFIYRGVSGWCRWLEFFGGVGSLLVWSGYEWSSGVFDCLAIRYGCGCVDPPLCPRGSVFCLVFSLVLGFGFVFRLGLGVVWYCSAIGLLLFCLNDLYKGLDGLVGICGLNI